MRIGELFEAVRRAYYHITSVNNLPSIQQNGLEPRVGTLSRLAGEPRPTIFLFPNLESVEDALMGWLGEYLPEEETLALLKVSLPLGIKPKRGNMYDDGEQVGYEFKVYQTIPPENIQILSTDVDNFNFPMDENRPK